MTRNTAELYARSVADPESFWAGEAGRHRLDQTFHAGKGHVFGPGSVSIKWFEDGATNVAQNCIDAAPAPAQKPHRDHLGRRRSEGLETYHLPRNCTTRSAVSPMSSRRMGSRRATRSRIYLPMIPEAAYAMLACARIGAVHSVVFGGFSPDSLAGRIADWPLETPHHCRRRAARRPHNAAQGACRRGHRENRAVSSRPCSLSGIPAAPSHGRTAATSGITRPRASRNGMPLRRDERGRPSLHPLYIRLDWNSERRGAYDGGLSRLRQR